MVFVEGLVLRRALKKFSEEQLVISGSIILDANFSDTCTKPKKQMNAIENIEDKRSTQPQSDL